MVASFDSALTQPLAMQVTPPDWPGGYWWHWLFFTVAIIAFVLIMVMGAIYIERRGMGRMQSRLGPNRTGPFGLLQPVADAVKVLLKENIVPTTADKIVHWLAPVVAFAPVLVIFAVVPFPNGGVLAIVGVVIVSGSLSMNQIVTGQDIPYILVQPLGFLIFFIAACAEINRSPFDLMEADSELTAGFHTEYSGMKFAMFYLVEYAEAIAMSAIIATLFLSGWRGPWLPPWLWFIIKTFVVFFVMVWTRTTLPRVRIDQLMGLAWKFLFPLALINLFVTAIQVIVLPDGS